MVCCCVGERVAGKLSLRIQQLDVMCATLHLHTPAHPSARSRMMDLFCVILHLPYGYALSTAGQSIV